MKLIVQTQYRENYGTEAQPYWKFKGGDTIVVEGADLNNIAALVAEVIGEVEYDNPMATNAVIDWYVLGDCEEVQDAYGITEMRKVGGQWKREYKELVA